MATLTFRTMTGHYVCAEPDGRMIADRTTAQAWETFQIEPLHSNLVAFKSAHKTYVSAETGGGGILIANRSVAGPWESFRLHQVGSGVALETMDGHYWCAEGGGGGEVNATRTSIGAWETFNGPVVIPPPGPTPPPTTGRTGQVKAQTYAATDDGGPWLAQGTSLFWGLWGWLHDPDRVLANVQAARNAGMDFIRVFGTVGSDSPSDSWFDRRVNCESPGWAEAARTFTDVCYTHGLRVQWSIFGSTSYAPTKEKRRAAVERLCLALQSNPHAVFSLEIGNESWQNGFEGEAGAAELKDLAVVARAHGQWLVATTAPRTDSCLAQSPYYQNSAATAVTLHFARTSAGEGGEWRYVRQPWREGTKSCPGGPKFYVNNEPKELAGKGDPNPLRVAFSAAVSWQCNVGAYVLHTGAGIRGGGAADLAVGRKANLWEVPGWGAVTAALMKAKTILPSSLTNWNRSSSNPSMFTVQTFEGPSNPGKGTINRVYTSTLGPRFMASLINIHKPTTLVAKQRMRVTAYNPLTWTELRSGTVLSGEKLNFSTSPGGVVLLGELL